ncbi:hypothetical protein AVEN_165097-1 [Araneus ventricosus]|uniref:Uncharacterized protein n=1 Tax=Araneus ventricosus TaxID=182803 RepID=A0A4Y2WWE3_ARAVE|nr:hypothetical protein AVEN_165097-1 [Araneus ventricosus]
MQASKKTSDDKMDTSSHTPLQASPSYHCRKMRRVESAILRRLAKSGHIKQLINSTDPHPDERRKALNDLDVIRRENDQLLQKIKGMGCSIPNCCLHNVNDEDYEKISSGSEEEQSSSEEESDQDISPPASTGNMEVEFQVVSPRKAARRPSPAKNLPPVTTANRFDKLNSTPAPRETREFPASINLKPRDNYSTLLKEITEKFPGTTNKFLYGYINIQAASDENRLQIVQLLTEKKEEFC